VALVVARRKITRARRDKRIAVPRVALLKPRDESGHGREIRLTGPGRQRLLGQPRGVLGEHRARGAPV
jgi:hypothetical protein